MRSNLKITLMVCVQLVALVSAGAQQEKLTRAEIKDAEQRLAAMGYWTGPIDGVLDPASESALVAFQKFAGRAITSQLTTEELKAIRSASLPTPREGGYEHVEVDLDRQVLLLVSEDDKVRVIPVSTGSGQPFLDEGEMSVAYTPRGRFIVYEKHAGWEYGPLGPLFYANYISGGVAIHGSRNVPTDPVSHGCIRIPLYIAREVSRLLPVGTIVLVYDNVSFVSAKSWALNPKLKQASIE